MSSSLQIGALVLLALLAANLPFANHRVCAFGPLRAPKSLPWRLLELVVLGAATLGIGFVLESSIGQRAPQGWEFYWAFGFLFTTLAFPGFVWRYLRRQ